MKKMILIMLSLLLLLCGCRKESDDSPQLTGNPESDPSQWNWFYWLSQCNSSEEISISLTDNATLQWDGKAYTLTQDDTVLVYSSLICRTDVEKTDNSWYYITEYVLTDSEESSVASTDNVIYRDAFFCNSPAEFGNVPESITALLESYVQDYSIHHFLPQSRFVRTIAGGLVDREESIQRWSYDGDLLCEFHVDGFAECFTELDDGGFLATLHNYRDNTYRILRYGSDGAILWETPLGNSAIPTITQILLLPDGIYGFGRIRQESSFEDVYVCHLSYDGKILDQKILGGTDYDTLQWVEVSDSGFSVWGSTQCNDGDFPLSKVGYGVDYLMQLSPDFDILSVAETDHDYSYFDIRGYANGSPIFEGDSILSVSSKDQLPTDNISPRAFFSYQDGYVVLRALNFEYYPYSSIVASYCPSYCQIIATGYDKDGNPQWQTVSKPHIS